MKELNEMIAVMEWFDSGNKVECCNNTVNKWEIIDDPIWAWSVADYRKAGTQWNPEGGDWCVDGEGFVADAQEEIPAIICRVEGSVVVSNLGEYIPVIKK